MSEPLTADPWSPAEEAGMRERLLDEDAVIYAADLARAIATLDAARDRPGLGAIVKAARKYHDHRTRIQPYDKMAPPQHYAADGCIKTFDREMKAAALVEAQQREGAGS